MYTFCCFSIFFFFSGGVKSVFIYVYRDIYIIYIYRFFISSRADDKYHGYQSLAGICCQVRSQLAGCKQSTIIALGRLPPADQVTETALMAFRRSYRRCFALALVSLRICSCPNNPNMIIQRKLLYSVLYPAGKYVTLRHIHFDLK